MTALDLYALIVQPGARPCEPGLAFLNAHGQRPADEVLDLALTTVAGCAHVRWLAVQLWGARARESIHRGHLRCLAEIPRRGEPLRLAWHEETTREVAGWLREAIAVAEVPGVHFLREGLRGTGL